MGFSEPVDERTKADPLNNSFDQDVTARPTSCLPEYG
jgi:hypothetical protein